jgi:hypothetical protein
VRIRLLTGVFVLTACPVQQAIDDFFEEFGTQPGESTSTGGETSSSDTGTSTSTAGEESTRAMSESSSGAAAESAAGDSTSDATTSDTASTTAETSGPTPFCGDGVVDPATEECDDWDLDLCVECKRVRIIFVTSLLLSGEDINGLTGADAYCNASANMAKQADPESPLNPGKFRALLSTSTVPAVSRHFVGKGPYRLVNGLQVSRSFEAMFTEPLEHPINVDEFSHTQTGEVWTGTDVDGSQYPGIDFCGDWHDNYGTANAGLSYESDSKWIHFYLDTDCISQRSIYCIEQE